MNLILLAEDDERLAQLVKDYLEGHDFRVVVEANGLAVARRVQDLKPDIVLLDIMLPGKDGMSICQDIRPAYSGPILMLTARNSDADQILGLEYGADDYVIKPAEPRILLARIRALLRRYQNSEDGADDYITLGRLHIDIRARNVTLKDAPVDLSCHEFDLLRTLARQAGETLSRDHLFAALYSRPYDGLDRAVDILVSHLRRKLGDNTQKPEKIKTVWGKGYMLVPSNWN
jgi:DNA-binding response OmpR family regulator